MFLFGKPSKSKFASQLREAIQKFDVDSRFEYDPQGFRLLRRDGDGEINLTNLYHEHCTLPRKDRKAHLERLASVFGISENTLPETFDAAKPNLRPKIWNRSSFAFLELRCQIDGGQQFDIPLYPLGGHLYSSLVYDTEAAMRTISNEELEAWGASYYEAFEVACQNLEESTIAFAKIGDNFHSAISGDNYDSSRILLRDRIRSFAVAGDPIAIVPQRDAMYVAGSEDETALKILFELTAKTYGEEARPLCPLPMKFEDGEWIDWIPPKNHIVRPLYDDLELQFLGGLYAEQKEAMDALFEKTQHPSFVATFSALQSENDETEKLRSYCVWGRGVDALLPRTQFIILMTEEGVAAAGEWEHVASVAGTLMVPDHSWYPIRYRVREFPSAAQLAEIGKMEP